MTYFPETSTSPHDASALGSPPKPVSAPVLTLGQRAAGFWLNFLFWSVGRMPWLAHLTCGFWIWMAWIFSPALRRYTLINARHLLQGNGTHAQVRKMARSILRSFYLFVYDVGRHGRMTPTQMRDEVASITGEDHYETARRLKRGTILATAHLGSFEVAATLLREREPNLSVVFRRDRFSIFDQVRSKLHIRQGIREVAIDAGVAAWLKIGESLRNDEVVLMQADRVLPGQRGIIVPFLDAALEVPIGPAKLAMLTGAPIVPVFAIRRDDGRIDIQMHPPIDPRSSINRSGLNPQNESTGEANVQSITHALSRILEGVLKEHPSQWLALHDAWHPRREVDDSTSDLK